MRNSGKKLARLAQAVLLVCSATVSLAAAGESAIDPKAVERLKTSMDFLSTQQRFSLLTSTTIEAVLTNGQKIQFDNLIAATVQRPNKFHARRLGDLVNQEFFYDGRSLTLQDVTAGYHASVEAPETLEGMLDFARDRLDIVAPAQDFIHKDAFSILMDGVESAMHLGASYVEGEICDHLAFSAPDNGTDWQIWIQRGDQPLPRRIVITSRDILNAPQFAVHIREWDLSPDPPEDLFEFNVSDSTTEIEFILLNPGESQQ